jgi:putative N6-adenine-specific DNA methylase
MLLFAPCPRGLEALLADEITALGASAVRISPGGVAFEGDAAMVCQVNLRSRLASRVLRQVGAGRCRDEDELGRVAASVPWEQFMTTRQTLRVDTTAVRSPLRSLNFANLRVKDAVVDRLRQTRGDRPSIDTRRPDVRVFAFLQEQQVTLYLDTSGESLFKRGWRREREDKGLAPLKENLAAGLLMLAGWTPERPLLDPYCGSGTLLIEAAQMALGIAPGLSRAFGFERLRDHDPAQWAQIRGEAIRQAQQAGPTLAARLSITGIDIDPIAIEQARRNIERAGVGGAGIRLAMGDAARISPAQPGPGVIVTNPPYGERIAAHQDGQPAPEERNDASDETHRQAMAAFGRGLKERFGGWQVHVLSSDRELPRQLGIRESRKTLLYNGALECRLFRFDVFDRATRETHDREHQARHDRMRQAAATGSDPAPAACGNPSAAAASDAAQAPLRPPRGAPSPG